MEAKIIKTFTESTPGVVDLKIGQKVLVLSETENRKCFRAMHDSTILIVPKDFLSVDPITNYHGSMRKDEAEKLLADNPLTRTFIIRDGEVDPDKFIISLKISGIVNHVDIEKTEQSRFKIFNVDFPSINDLIKYFSRNLSMIDESNVAKKRYWCGSTACQVCERRRLPTENVLDGKRPGLPNRLFPNPHYLLFDMPSIVNKMNILQENEFVNVIISNDFFKELENGDKALFDRLENITCNPERHFFLFENVQECIDLEPGESIKEMRQRAAHTYTQWYNAHLQAQNIPITVVLITNDEKSKKEAMQKGITVATLKEYISSLNNSSSLIRKLIEKYGPLAIEESNQEVYEDIELCILLQANAENDDLKMPKIINTIKRRKPLFVGIHYPPLEYFEESLMAKHLPEYKISYGNILTSQKKCQSLILIKILDDKVSVGTVDDYNCSTSLNGTIVQSSQYKKSRLICYSISKDANVKYYEDEKGLRKHLEKPPQPTVAFISLEKIIARETPAFMDIKMSFVQVYGLIQLTAPLERTTENYLFINNMLKSQFCLHGIKSQVVDGNTYIKIVTAKKNQKKTIL